MENQELGVFVWLLPLLLGLLVFWAFSRFGIKSRTDRSNEKTTEKTTEKTLERVQKQKPTSKWWLALSNSRAKFLLGGKFSGEISELKESLEEACLISDLGVSNTEDALKQVNWSDVSSRDQNERLTFTKKILAQVVSPWLKSSSSIEDDHLGWLRRHLKPSDLQEKAPVVVWFVGVNGVGKTTSISKLALELKNNGHTVLLAAGDTFRAAAGEQLEIWAERLGIPIVKGAAGADPSSVLFDGVASAKAKGIEFVLCDSAGRLHNQNQLMEALKKNKRVLEKSIPGAPHETLLVLDAGTGQNMVSQATEFMAAVEVSGLILTKLDGSARGGAVVAVARKTSLPIRRLGLGEKPEDFVAFDAEEFSKALFGLENS